MEPPIRIDRDHSVLLLIDIQPDFMPGGNLPVAEGERIVAPVNALLASGRFRHVVATQDWHPPGHISFASSHPGRQPLERIELYGHEQTLWPDHCIQGSAGAQLHPDLTLNRVDAVIRKGTDPACDSYSGFRNNWNPQGERPATGLAGYLKERGVRHVYLCGLARDVCVAWSAEDAVAAGFNTWLVWDLTRSVNPVADTQLRERLGTHGVTLVGSDHLA